MGSVATPVATGLPLKVMVTVAPVMAPQTLTWTTTPDGLWVTLRTRISPLPLPVVLVPIGGRTYRVQRIEGTALAPIQWRLTRLHPPLEDGPYYACRLHDGSTQCDCAEWTYQVAGNAGRPPCKHLAALDALWWI